ncbi:flagellin hook IN motif-containing protein, partial [Nautilia lithotrophica]
MTRFETGMVITAATSSVALKFIAVDGTHNVTLESVKVSTSAGTGIGVLAEVINKNSDKTGVKASWQVLATGDTAIAGGTITSFTINGIKIGTISVAANDSDGKLVAAINAVKDQTGVEAYVDERGNLNLRSLDGRGIALSGSGLNSVIGLSANYQNYGRLTLTRLDARDIIVSGTNYTHVGFNNSQAEAQRTINLRTIKGSFNKDQASAIGAFANANVVNYGKSIGAGVTTL